MQGLHPDCPHGRIMKQRTSAAAFTALALCAALSSAVPAQAAEPPAIAKKEIDHLLDYVGNSGCEFYRNGSWFDGKRGQAHLRDKYQFLVGRDMIQAASDFIDKAATQSSFSSLAYKVRCGSGEPVPSAQWLNAELARFRSAVH